MENNTVIITVEEYRSLIEAKLRAEIEAEYAIQIDNLKKEAKAESDDALNWYRKYNVIKDENAKLRDELSFYKPAQQEQEAS